MNQKIFPDPNLYGVTKIQAEIISSLDVSLPTTILGEGHPIPIFGDHVINLNLIPKASDEDWNAWVDIPTLEGIGFAVTVGGAPRTLTATFPPSSGQVFVGIAQLPYSTRLAFHSSDGGNTASIDYVGLYSQPEAHNARKRDLAIQRLEHFHWLSLWSSQTYSNGYWNGIWEDDTRVHVMPSQFLISGQDGTVAAFPGAILEFGSGGNVEVGAFSNASYYKRILVCVDVSSGPVWVFSTVESAEEGATGALLDPETPEGWISLGMVDVQNTGVTGTAGAVLPIEQADIQTKLGVFTAASKLLEKDLNYFGSLAPGEIFDTPVCLGKDGILHSFVLYAGDAGSANETLLDIYRHDPGDNTGTDLFDTPANRPAISGDAAPANRYYQQIEVPQANFDQTLLTFTANQFFRVVINTAATDANMFRSVFRYY